MQMDIKHIMELLPHSFPFIMIDRVLEYEAGVYAICLKNITATEWWVPGHFTREPVFPGVLSLESLAQTCAISLFGLPEVEHREGFLSGLDCVKFRRKVIPGDAVNIRADLDRTKGGIYVFNAVATVGDETATEAVVKLAFAPKESA